eukprot:TRINITY_DN3754_c0_g1_i2.p1 TRINITY_DN3754_c0_g1~~TRINITY_DN3754_c0_g1_i2.p1  ORF type:complete len:212 (+),score=75.60 TRINITY_DN3754_c0_g1_i2:83-718(+)
MDPIQKSSDVYVTVKFMKDDDKDMQSTDVHWKAKKEALFNWRMLFDVDLPMDVSRIKMAVWDKDYVGSSDNIGEVVIDLGPYFKKAMRTRQKVTIANKAKVYTTHPNHKQKDPETGKRKTTATVKWSAYMVPMEEALMNPVSYGYDEDDEQNHSPKLKAPLRPPNSINPARIDLLLYYWFKKSLKYILCALCIVIMAYILQFVFTFISAVK